MTSGSGGGGDASHGEPTEIRNDPVCRTSRTDEGYGQSSTPFRTFSDTEIVFRRLVAFFMLLAVTFSYGETVTGMLRDGAVHHEESAATAALHAIAAQGEHGHEDGSSHGPGHEHGTPADHCTHQHGTEFGPRSPGLAVFSCTIPDIFLEPSLRLDHPYEPSFRPPRA